MKIHKRGGHGVDVQLHSMRTTQDVFWSKRANSYVLVEDKGLHGKLTVEDGTPVRLYSINGIGEIRWLVNDFEWGSTLRLEKEGKLDPIYDSAEHLAAARHFGLVWEGVKL